MGEGSVAYVCYDPVFQQCLSMAVAECAGKSFSPTCAESEEETQVWSVSQQTINSDSHPPVAFIDQFAAKVGVYLARDCDIWRRSGAMTGRQRRLVVDVGKQRGVEVAAVVLLDEVVGRVQRHKSLVDGQQRG